MIGAQSAASTPSIRPGVLVTSASHSGRSFGAKALSVATAGRNGSGGAWRGCSGEPPRAAQTRLRFSITFSGSSPEPGPQLSDL